MKKLILFFLFFLFTTNYVYPHVAHYNKINSLKYGLYLNNKLIGNHSFTFTKNNNFLVVNSSGNFKVSKLGVELMNFNTKGEEIYEKGKLIKFISNTQQNDKSKFVKVLLKNNKLLIDGSSYKGETKKNISIGSWWNHEIIKISKQISPISGRIIKQRVDFLGKEKISINNVDFNALHFHFTSDDDKPLAKKKLNMHVWYDEKTLLWIKSSYDKFGLWEYRLIEQN